MCEDVNSDNSCIPSKLLDEDCVEPSLFCIQCKGELKDPQLLSCLHSVCADCLPNISVKGKHLQCTLCGDTSTYRKDGDSRSLRQCTADGILFPIPNTPLACYIEGLDIARQIAKGTSIACGNTICKNMQGTAAFFCINCNKFLCEPCIKAHNMIDIFKDHIMKSLDYIRGMSHTELQTLCPLKSDTHTCPIHRGKPLEYQCEKCLMLMCQVCTTDRHPQFSHAPKFLNPQSDTTHSQLAYITQQVAVEFDTFCQQKEECAKTEEVTLKKEKEKVAEEIQYNFQILHHALENRKKELCEELEVPYMRSQAEICTQLKTLSKERSSLPAIHTMLTMFAGLANEDVVNFGSHMRAKLHSITATKASLQGKCSVSHKMLFLPENQESVLKAIRKFGIIEDGESPDYCKVEPHPEKIVSRGSDPVKFNVITVNSNKVRCKHGGEIVEAFLRPHPPNQAPPIRANVVDHGNGNYTVRLSYTYPCRCNLVVLLNGENICGSPFCVNFHKIQLPQISRNIREVGTNKISLGVSGKAMIQPWGVAVSASGTIFVCDNKRKNLHMFNDQRKYVKRLFSDGQGPIQFKSPCNLTFDDANKLLFIADSLNSYIVVLMEDGSYLTTIQHDTARHPWSVAVNELDRCIYAACDGKIVVFSVDGQYVRKFGSKGSSPGYLDRPSSLAFSSDGDLYVLDHDRVCVLVFNPEGGFVREFAHKAFNCPTDILVTADDFVLVADVLNNRVAVFTLWGKLVKEIPVSKPHGLAIDSTGCLLVTDNLTKKLHIMF